MHRLLLLRQLALHLLLFLLLAPGTFPCTLSLCLPHLLRHLFLQCSHLAQCSLMLLAALLVLRHLPLQSMHRFLLLRQLAFHLLLLPLLASGAFPCTLPFCLPHLLRHLLLQCSHLAHSSLVLLAALLVLRHLPLQSTHRLLLLRQLALHLLLFPLLALGTLPLCSPHLLRHLLLQCSHLAHSSLMLLAALLVLRHLPLQSMHRLLLLRQLALHLLLLLLLALGTPH